MTPTISNPVAMPNPATVQNPNALPKTSAKTSFLRSFFSFDEFITARIVKVFYTIGLLLILLAAVSGIGSTALAFLYAHNYLDAIMRFPFIGELVYFILQIAGFIAVGALSILLLRLFCEFILVIFRINDNLQILRSDNAQKK